MQKNWEICLKDAYALNAKARGKRNRSIKLPSEISFVGEGEQVQLILSVKGAAANMQSDEAAFEGRCLALRRWCEVEVMLRWSPPPKDAPKSQRRQSVSLPGGSLPKPFRLVPD